MLLDKPIPFLLWPNPRSISIPPNPTTFIRECTSGKEPKTQNASTIYILRKQRFQRRAQFQYRPKTNIYSIYFIPIQPHSSKNTHLRKTPKPKTPPAPKPTKQNRFKKQVRPTSQKQTITQVQKNPKHPQHSPRPAK